MAFDDLLILEYNGVISGCRFGADGEIEYYTQDDSGNWQRAATESSTTER